MPRKMPKSITAIKKKELSQTLNLEKIFGVDLTNEPRLIDEIGQEFLDIIETRTESKKDLFGDPFDKYSKEYYTSDTFKDFGKSKSDINMELTGKMRESVDFKFKDGDIVIEVSDKEAAKAANHQLGDTVPQRAWFGISDKELKDVVDTFSSEIERVSKKKPPSAQSILDLATTQSLEAQTAEEAFADLFGASFDGVSMESIFGNN